MPMAVKGHMGLHAPPLILWSDGEMERKRGTEVGGSEQAFKKAKLGDSDSKSANKN